MTALIEKEAIDRLDQLRSAYFPKDRNFLKAHVTLFHAAPLELVSVWNLPAKSLDIEFGEPFFIGKGFAVKARCLELCNWRQSLLNSGLAFTAQDLALRQLHVTIQNKVDPVKAKSDFEKFKQVWTPITSRVIGIETWNYENGPWRHLQTYYLGSTLNEQSSN